MTADGLPVFLAVLAIALLYSSIGQAGASGYIAVMSLAGLAPDVVRPTALLLNVLVAALASFQFWRAGYFSWPLFWPFALAAVPFAFVGGALALPERAFEIVVGAVLVFAAVWLLRRPRLAEEAAPPSRPLALAVGGGLGFLAGLTGTGGGIFLTPVLLIGGWASPRTAAALTAPFVLVNSLAGLAGNLSVTRGLPPLALPLAAAAIAGGGLGSWLGSRHLPQRVIEGLLALVLALGGLKLAFGS